MKKSQINRIEKVKKRLCQHKIHELRMIEYYKLSVDHIHCHEIDTQYFI